MTLFRDALRALRLTAVLWLITVVLYTLPLLAIGQGLFPFKPMAPCCGSTTRCWDRP